MNVLKDCSKLELFRQRYNQMQNHSQLPQSMEPQLMEKPHEIFCKERDFDQILSRYRRREKTSYSQEELLLVAKAHFQNEEYDLCLSVIEQINPLHNTKVLFQRQSLKFRALYLQKRENSPQNFQQLEDCVTEFDRGRRSAPGLPFKPQHLQTMQSYGQFVTFLKKYIKSKISYSAKLFSEQEDLDKQSHKKTGFPCYLISQQWLDDYSNMKRNVREKAYLGPVTNFAIVNDIFECHQYQNEMQKYKSTVVFPVSSKYKVISKKLWALYCSVFAEDHQFAPIRRLYQEKLTSYSYSAYSQGSSQEIVQLVPAVVNCDSQLLILQLTANELVSKELISIIEEKYGFGQLRSPANQEESFDFFYGADQDRAQKELLDWNKILHYRKVALPDSLKKIKIFRHIDSKPLHLSFLQKKQGGLKGLQNLGNSCYMNSCLQCVSFTKEITAHLVSRDLAQEVLRREEEKGGQVTMALSALLKELWKESQQKYFSPFKFKKYFGISNTMFQGKTQEDAHEFLLHLLNNIHEDLRGSQTKVKRMSTKLEVTTNVKDVESYFNRHEVEPNKSIVMDLFRGKLHTSITCNSCKTASHGFDVFLALSLPVPYVSYPTIKFYFVKNRARVTSFYQVCLKGIATFNDLFGVFQKEVLQGRKESPPNKWEGEQVSSKLEEQEIKYNYLLLEFDKTQDPNEIWNSGLGNPLSKKQLPIEQLAKSKKQLVLYEVEEKKMEKLRLVLIEYKISYTFQKDKALGFPRFCYISEEALTSQEAKSFKKTVVGNDFQNLLHENDIDVIKAFSWKSENSSFKYSLTVFFKREEKLSFGSSFVDRQLNSSEDTYNLRDCFREMGKPEALEDGWKCGNCSSDKGAQKRQFIVETNKILIITLKRFQAGGSKIKNMVQYPLEYLNISEWLQERTQFGNVFYDLYAVCLHTGTMEYGHYRAYCKHFITKEWFQFDDERVRKADPADIVSPHAYMMFYKRRDT